MDVDGAAGLLQVLGQEIAENLLELGVRAELGRLLVALLAVSAADEGHLHQGLFLLLHLGSNRIDVVVGAIPPALAFHRRVQNSQRATDTRHVRRDELLVHGTVGADRDLPVICKTAGCLTVAKSGKPSAIEGKLTAVEGEFSNCE